ncbi:MAG: hypothetical protein E7385_03045 [Ruminococcaceae bacterium]|nr:hypothetical protein [Oscillospiraceae bacterium]
MKKNKNRYWIIPLIIILVIIVFISGILVGSRLKQFTSVQMSTDFYIKPNVAGQIKITSSNSADKGNNSTAAPVTPKPDAAGATAKPQIGVDIMGENPDGSLTEEFILFKAQYENATGETTVKSLTGDNIIAPGTENEYKMRIINTGNVAIDYYIDIGSIFTYSEDSYVSPLEVRLIDASGKYLIGSESSWERVEDFKGVTDMGTLGRNSYSYYTLQWRWPFERGEGEEVGLNDMLDTIIANATANVNIEVGLEVNIYAALNPDPDSPGGVEMPETGDSSFFFIWFLVAGLALLLLIILPFIKRRSDDEEEDNEMAEGTVS